MKVILLLKSRGVAIGLLGTLFVAYWIYCESQELAKIKPNQDLESALLSQYPTPVSISPTGEHLLLKTRHRLDFEIFVVHRFTRKIVASDRSPDTQLSMTWRPDGQAIVFQESLGGNRDYRLFLLDLHSGKRLRINAPSTRTAAPPLRWSPDGRSLAYCQTSGTGDGRIHVVNMINNSSILPNVLNSVSPDGDFAWSSDGRYIAAVSADSGTILIAGIDVAVQRELRVSPGGKIRHIAWSPDGKSILLTLRLSGQEYYQLFEFDLETSHLTARALHDGDVSSPTWLIGGKSFSYQVNQAGNTILYWRHQDGSNTQLVAHNDGVDQIQSVTQDGYIVHLIRKPATEPPSLHEVNLRNGKSQRIFSSPSYSSAESISPSAIHIKSKDGRSIPGLLWRPASTTNNPNFILIDIHGGPHIHSNIEWDAAKQFLLRKGIQVLSIDYRGSSGHGFTFEQETNFRRQTDDVVAACNYAFQVLKIPKGNIALMGSSYGSVLAMSAIPDALELLAGVVLISVPSAPLQRVPSDVKIPIYAFHGQSDSVLSPFHARIAIEGYLGTKSLLSPMGYWEVIPAEGHHFHKTLSWAKVYTAIIELVSASKALEDNSKY